MTAPPVTAPPGAIGWSARDGWIFDQEVLQRAMKRTAPDMALLVSRDGLVHGVLPHDLAPLIAVLRIETELADMTQALLDLSDRAQGLDTDQAVAITQIRARLERLGDRLTAVEAMVS